MKKKMLNIITILIFSIGIVACSSNTLIQEKLNGDEDFIKTFETEINKRWKNQKELDKIYEQNATFSDEDYTKETIEILEEEIKALEEKQNKIEDRNLKSYAIDYIEGSKKQVEATKSEDYELQDKYMQESEKLRKPALIALVEEYGVKIDKEHEQTYKDFKEMATIINKENESQSYADKLASEIEFEKTTDEFGYTEFKATVENKSEFNFKSLSYNVQYKDKEGTVVGNDTIYLENFNKNSKQQIKLLPYEEGIEGISITTDWFEVQ